MKNCKLLHLKSSSLSEIWSLKVELSTIIDRYERVQLYIVGKEENGRAQKIVCIETSRFYDYEKYIKVVWTCRM